MARQPIADFEAYRDALEARLGKSREVMRFFIHKAQQAPKRIVFPEGAEPRVLQAARQFYSLRLGAPLPVTPASVRPAIWVIEQCLARRS